MSGSNSRRGMGGRDVITVGIFSAIYFAINFAFMLLGGLHPLLWILMPGFIALFTGIPYLMMCAKVQKVGSVLLMGLITGLIYFVTGQFTPVILVSFVIACGATGLFNPVKGGHFIPLVLEELYRRGHRNLHLLLFGNQEKNVEFPFPSTNAGFITDMNKLAGLYSAADIFLNPTLQDVLSNVALESMACKTPSVTFRTGGVPEVVLDGRTGLVAPQGDLNQMAGHCERLIRDGKLLLALAEEGRQHAEQTFSYPVIAARHAALYEETLREYRREG